MCRSANYGDDYISGGKLTAHLLCPGVCIVESSKRFASTALHSLTAGDGLSSGIKVESFHVHVSCNPGEVLFEECMI